MELFAIDAVAVIVLVWIALSSARREVVHEKVDLEPLKCGDRSATPPRM